MGKRAASPTGLTPLWTWLATALVERRWLRAASGGQPSRCLAPPNATAGQGQAHGQLPDERFRLLVDGTRDYAILMLDPTGHILTWNQGGEQIKGYRAEEVLGRHFSVFYTPEAVHTGHPDRELALAEQHGRYEEEGWRVRKDGSHFWASVVITALHDQAGELVGFGKVTRDLTDRQAAQQLLQRAQARFNAAFARSPAGLAITTAAGTYAQVNQALLALADRTHAELLDQPPVELFVPAHRPALHLALQQLRAGVIASYTGEHQALGRDGSVRLLAVHVVPLHDDGRLDAPDLLWHYDDITQQRQSETALAHQADHDPLTGLPNRALLARRFQEALHDAAHDGQRVGLLLIDLDRFKDVNDTFGHHSGDELLVQVGARLQALLRQADTIARLGGDEFAVLLPDIADTEAVLTIAAKIISALRETFRVEGVELDVDASIGAVLSGVHGSDPGALLQRADVAMYVAKAQNLGVFVYDAARDQHTPARLALLGDLRRALERDELLLHYQPKIGLATGDVVGVEALVRWQHPEHGLLAPDSFIPLAEHTGLIDPLTSHVLSRALAQARRWADHGRPLPIAVNLSARNLLDDQLPDRVADLLRLHGVAPQILTLEVTESAIMTDPARALRVLEHLVRLGIRISLDDFGAGYTSLSHLKTLPVTELKIDKCFVTALPHDRGDAHVVRSLIDLGHDLGLTIVAEGIETADALELLIAYGCDTGQGHHLSTPLPATSFDHWYADRGGGADLR